MEMINLEIEFLDHSSFLIKSSMGKRILIDPCHCTKIKELDNISLITISHNHIDHNYIPDSLKMCECIQSSGEFTVGDIQIKGIPSFHDDLNGEKRGENIIYTYIIDNLKLCHLGDLGHNLTSIQLKDLNDIDILFIPIGGNFTLDGKQASNLCNILKPKVVIPMHYTKSLYDLTLDSIDQFILSMKNGEVFPNPWLVDIKSSYNNKVVIL